MVMDRIGQSNQGLALAAEMVAVSTGRPLQLIHQSSFAYMQMSRPWKSLPRQKAECRSNWANFDGSPEGRQRCKMSIRNKNASGIDPARCKVRAALPLLSMFTRISIATRRNFFDIFRILPDFEGFFRISKDSSGFRRIFLPVSTRFPGIFKDFVSKDSAGSHSPGSSRIL